MNVGLNMTCLAADGHWQLAYLSTFTYFGDERKTLLFFFLLLCFLFLYLLSTLALPIPTFNKIALSEEDTYKKKYQKKILFWYCHIDYSIIHAAWES